MNKLLSFTLLLPVACSSLGAAILVDINRENTSIWTDATSYPYGPESTTGVVAYLGSSTDTTFNPDVYDEGTFSFGLSASGSNIYNRDRNSTTYGPKNNFFRDFAGASNGSSYTLTLSNLSAGTYTYTSWHYDPASTQFSASSEQTRSVFLTDLNHTASTVGTATSYGSDGSTGALDDPSDPDPFNTVQPFTTTIISNGTDDVVITYGSGTNAFVINGFELVQVPEPGTLFLLSGGMLLLIGMNARGRRSKS